MTDPSLHSKHVMNPYFTLNLSSQSPYAIIPYSSKIPQPGRKPHRLQPKRPQTARPTRSTNHTPAPPNIPHYARPIESAVYAQPVQPKKPYKRPASATVSHRRQLVQTSTPTSTSSVVSHEIHRPRRKHHTSSDFPVEHSSSTVQDQIEFDPTAPAPTTFHPVLSGRAPPTIHNLNRMVPAPEGIISVADYLTPSTDSTPFNRSATPPPITSTTSSTQPLSPASAEAYLGIGGGTAVKRPKPRPATALPLSTNRQPAMEDDTSFPPSTTTTFLVPPIPPPPPYESGSTGSSAFASPLSSDDLGRPLQFVVDWDRELLIATGKELPSSVRSPQPDGSTDGDAESVASTRSHSASATASNATTTPSVPLFIRQKQEQDRAAGKAAHHQSTKASSQHSSNLTGWKVDEESKEVSHANDLSNDYDSDEFLAEDDLPLPSTSFTHSNHLDSSPPHQASLSSEPLSTESASNRLRSRSGSSHRTALQTARHLQRSMKQVEDFLVGQVAFANEIAQEYQLNRSYKALKISMEMAKLGSNTPAANSNTNSGLTTPTAATHATTKRSTTVATSTTTDSESKFIIRVYQTHPRLILRDVQLSQFNRELAHLLQTRDALDRRHSNSLSLAQRRHVTSEGKYDSIQVAQALKSVLTETRQMAAALEAQVELLNMKGIQPIDSHSSHPFIQPQTHLPSSTTTPATDKGVPSYATNTVTSSSRQPPRTLESPSAFIQRIRPQSAR